MSAVAGDALEVPVWQLADEALPGELQRLARAVRVLSARAVEVAAQAQQRGLPARAGHRRLAGWVAQALPTTSEGETARLARRAEALYCSPLAAGLAPTRQALSAGRICGPQADMITQTLAALVPPAVPPGTVDDVAVVQAQALLLREAATLDPRRLGRVASYLRHRLDPDADDRLARDEHRQDSVRGLTLSPLGTGMVHLDAILTKQCGAALRAAVDAWSAPRPAADGAPDPRTPAQRRHDGIQRLAEQAVAQPGLLPTSHGSPYRIAVTVGVEALAAALAGQPAPGVPPAELPDGPPLSPASLAEIACGADLVPVLVDGDRNPLDVGDTQYAFPAKQRLAIALRDRHCTYPRCTAPPAWCDVHHLQAFRAGGRTSVANGTLLCGHHHRHVHTSGLTGRLQDGAVTWSGDPPPAPPQPPTTRATRAIDHLARRWRARQQR